MEHDVNMDGNTQAIVIVTGIVCVTIIEAVALYSGVDGTMLAAAVGGICTMVGYAFGQILKKE